MATQILMPALSPTMEEGTLTRWLKAEGDAVTAGDVIAEIETDKATMEVEAVDEGRLGRILVPEGTEGVKVNAPIALLLEEGEDDSALDAAAPAASGANGSTGSAAPMPGPAPAAPAAAPGPSAPAGSNGARIFASPLARRIAADRGIDLAQVVGTGPRGRIVKADVEAAKAGAATSTATPETPAPAPAQAPGPYAAPEPSGAGFEAVARAYADRETEEVPLDGMRRTIAARLSEAKRTIPHFYLRRDIDLGALLETRRQMNARGEARGIKLSVNDFIIKACALALQDHPGCNAVWAGDRILRLKASDVAVAVAVEGGLFTPVLRDAETRSLSAISAEMKALAAKARDRRLAPEDYTGGSFAISNLGMYGIDNFDAVINPPHAAILAVGAGVEKPVVREGALAVATVMSVTLSVDHRVIDGAAGAQLLDTIRAYLEDPLSMVM